ncbi:hypothetical protein ACX1G6_11080 [Yersinia enterocolitica]
MTETALHRTRLHTLRYKVFSVLNSYKTTRQLAPWLGLCSVLPTEKIEKNFSVFQFLDLSVDHEDIYLIEFKVDFKYYGNLEVTKIFKVSYTSN